MLQGIRCCSDVAIAFHEMEGKKIYAMEYLVYHLEAYGIRTRASTEGTVRHDFNNVSDYYDHAANFN